MYLSFPEGDIILVHLNRHQTEQKALGLVRLKLDFCAPVKLALGAADPLDMFTSQRAI